MPAEIDPAFDRNPTLPGVHDPYPIFRHVREADPVHWCAEAGLWAITRYSDAQAVLKSEHFSRQAYLDVLEARSGPQPIIEMQRHELVFMDNPRHGALRRLAGEAINAGEIRTLQQKIDRLVEATLAPLLARDHFDVIADFACTLPTQVASEWLGISPEDRGQMVEWIFPLVSGRGVSRDPKTTAAANVAAESMGAYFLQLIENRRVAPHDDLTTALVRVQAESAEVSDADLVSLLIAVFAAGHGPGISMLANTLLALLRHPDQLAKLRARPDLVNSALEEGLRFDPPSQAPNPLAALTDVEIGGKTIRRGDVVSVILAAANRDPEEFPDPDDFDITRPRNHHLSFSGGAHFCLGAMLARAEGQSALRAVVCNLPELKLACDFADLHYIPYDRFRTLKALPVAFGQK